MVWREAYHILLGVALAVIVFTIIFTPPLYLPSTSQEAVLSEDRGLEVKVHRMESPYVTYYAITVYALCIASIVYVASKRRIGW